MLNISIGPPFLTLFLQLKIKIQFLNDPYPHTIFLGASITTFCLKLVRLISNYVSKIKYVKRYRVKDNSKIYFY